MKLGRGGFIQSICVDSTFLHFWDQVALPATDCDVIITLLAPTFVEVKPGGSPARHSPEAVHLEVTLAAARFPILLALNLPGVIYESDLVMVAVKEDVFNTGRTDRVETSIER